jgi:Transposase zinc-ribbon domain
LAREWFEARLWPNGPVCPHCGSHDRGVTKLQGNGGPKGKKHRPGLYQCNACREQFTVTVGTVMERSKIPLHIWLKAMYLLASSKKGVTIAKAPAVLPTKNAYLDGEVCGVLTDGRTACNLIQNAMEHGDASLVFFVFADRDIIFTSRTGFLVPILLRLFDIVDVGAFSLFH